MSQITTCSACDFDVAIIGGGPAGVAAAIGLTTEGVRVVVLDELQAGGQVASTSKIENVFGAPDGGYTGIQFMGRGIDQATAFGAKFRSRFRAVRILKDPVSGLFTIVAAGRERVTAAAVLLATGASFRRLEADDVERYLGRGVSYGAPQYQFPDQWTSKRVGIIGGGNSAGQAASFLSTCPGCTVDIFVRSEGLEHDMSSYLVDRVVEQKCVTVHSFSTVQAVRGDGECLRSVIVSQKDEKKEVPLDHLFVLIGAVPQTGWLEGTVALDEKGYILTDSDLPEGVWPKEEGRSALRFETSLPGVFAAGDSHSGSPNRMSIAVGEGHAVAVTLYRYLQERRK